MANAGIASGGTVLSMDPRCGRRSSPSTSSAYTGRSRALPHLIESRGYALPVASVAAIAHAPLMSAYCASKAGVDAFADSLRTEVQHHGVDVGCAYFSWIDTEMVRGVDRVSALDKMRSSLKPPFSKTYPVSVAANAVVKGIEGRRKRVSGRAGSTTCSPSAACSSRPSGASAKAMPEIERLYEAESPSAGARGLRARRGRWRGGRALMRRLLPILVVLAVLPATASAATGDLTQLTNPFGCHWFNQTDGVCQATTALHQPESIAISADGTSVYVANAQSESVVHFQRDPATGIINQPDDPTGCVSDTGSGPCVDGERLLFAIAVAVSPDGRNVYAAAANSSGVVILDRDPATGLLSQRTSGTLGCVSSDGSGGACVAAAGLDAVEDLAVSPDGENVYVASENGVVTLNRTEPLGDLQPGGCINEFGTGGCDNGKALWDTRGVTVSPDGKSVFTVSAGAARTTSTPAWPSSLAPAEAR